jgi:HD superfamily phosphohydrolase
VEIAGLIHDLGHSVFSHTFESLFLGKFPAVEAFHHEHASIGIFDVLIEDNDLMPAFVLCGLDDPDIHFIKELVLGDAKEAPAGFGWRGR